MGAEQHGLLAAGGSAAPAQQDRARGQARGLQAGKYSGELGLEPLVQRLHLGGIAGDRGDLYGLGKGLAPSLLPGRLGHFQPDFCAADAAVETQRAHRHHCQHKEHQAKKDGVDQPPIGGVEVAVKNAERCDQVIQKGHPCHLGRRPPAAGRRAFGHWRSALPAGPGFQTFAPPAGRRRTRPGPIGRETSPWNPVM